MKTVPLLWLICFIPCICGRNIYIETRRQTDMSPVTLTVNSSYEIELIYKDLDKFNTTNPFRIKTSSNSSNIFFTLALSNHVITSNAWFLPLDLKGGTLILDDSRSDFLNPDGPMLPKMSMHTIRELTVRLITPSTDNVNINVEFEQQLNYNVRLGEEYLIDVHTGEPRFTLFKFDSNSTDTIIIDVKSSNNSCLTVSVQASKCPSCDLNSRFKKIYQIISLNGSMTVNKNDFPAGFFLAFMAHENNLKCGQHNETFVNLRVSFHIKNGLTYNQYTIAIVATITVLILVALIFGYITVAYEKYLRKDITEFLQGQTGESCKSESSNNEYFTGVLRSTFSTLLLFLKRIWSGNKKKSLGPNTGEYGNPPQENTNNSGFLLQTVNMAMFYCIPVVQLLLNYQYILNQTGNQDMCYYNFMCAHPALGFSDFNHIFSNISYIFFGILYIVIVWTRSKLVQSKVQRDFSYQIYYSLGVALITEGILSAGYHFCPTAHNYQFDLTFMYIMAILTIIKFHQSRYEKRIFAADKSFTIFSIGILKIMLAIITDSLVILTIFTLGYMVIYLYLSLKTYRELRQDFVKSARIVSNDDKLVKMANADKHSGDIMELQAINMVNIGLLGAAIYLWKSNFMDFATCFLGILLLNIGMLILSYLKMKEGKTNWGAVGYGLMALCAWAIALLNFNGTTNWNETPAESRLRNRECILLNFYDQHDIWHFFSALGAFSSFMFVMYIDDDTKDDPSSTPKQD